MIERLAHLDDESTGASSTGWPAPRCSPTSAPSSSCPGGRRSWSPSSTPTPSPCLRRPRARPSCRPPMCRPTPSPWPGPTSPGWDVAMPQRAFGGGPLVRRPCPGAAGQARLGRLQTALRGGRGGPPARGGRLGAGRCPRRRPHRARGHRRDRRRCAGVVGPSRPAHRRAGPHQAATASTLAVEAGFFQVEVLPDLQGRLRALVGRM